MITTRDGFRSVSFSAAKRGWSRRFEQRVSNRTPSCRLTYQSTARKSAALLVPNESLHHRRLAVSPKECYHDTCAARRKTQVCFAGARDQEVLRNPPEPAACVLVVAADVDALTATMAIARDSLNVEAVSY